MFDRDRRTEHAPQALAFFIEQNRPPRVVVTNLDGATAISFHTDLPARSDFAKVVQVRGPIWMSEGKGYSRSCETLSAGEVFTIMMPAHGAPVLAGTVALRRAALLSHVRRSGSTAYRK